MSSTKNDLMKLKLDTIWQNVQASLPEINFDDKTTEHDDNLDIRTSHNNNLEDFDETDFEQNFERYLSRGEQFNVNDDQALEDVDMDDIVIDNNDKNHSNFSEFKTRIKARTSAESQNTAQKITKTIFESTSSRLNMDLFNTIDFDEMLTNVKSIGTDETANEKTDKCYLRGVGNTSRNALKDEQVLKKLAEMSSSLGEEEHEKGAFNIDYKTGALITTSTRCNTYTNKDLNPSYLIQKEASSSSINITSISPLSYLEQQLNQKNPSLQTNYTTKPSPLNLLEAQLTQNAEQTRRNEMNKFLKDHNIKDGNMVQTRRLDLRGAQSITKPEPKSVNSAKTNNPVEAFLAMKIHDYVNESNTNGKKFKYLNEASESSDSSSEDDEKGDCQLTGIARYRQQKLAAMKNIKVNS